MRLRVLVLGVLTAVVSAGGPAGGQDDRELKEPYAFFSTSPTEPAAGDPKGKVGTLYLRPNLEQQAYVFVRNPTNTDATVNVILSSGAGAKGQEQAGTEIARATGVAVKAKQTVRVPLAAAGKQAAPAAPPPPPAPPAAAGKDQPPAPPPPPAGVKLGKTQLALRVEYADEQNPRLKDADTRQTYELDVLKPSERLDARPEYNPATRQFVVTVSFKQARNYSYFTEAPAKVRLNLRPDLNPDLDPESLNAGTYEAELPPDGTVQLVAEGVRFRAGAERRAVVSVSVDGYDRAFLFETDFRAPNPGVYTGQFVNIKPSADKLIPGQPCQLQLEYSFQEGEDALNAELRVDRRGQGAFTDVVRRFTGLRKKEIYVRAGGPDDAVVFTSVLADWTYDFPTANVFGVRTFQILARSADGGRTLPTDDAARDAARYNIRNVRAIVLDRTPPAVAEFRRPRAAGLITGSRVTVQARVTEDLTGFRQVLFYLGDPPAADAKLVPGKVVRGKLVRSVSDTPNGPREHIYEGTLALPEAKGAVQVGVRVVNEVGIPNRDDEDQTFAVVDVRDPPAPKAKEKEPTTGTITGRVLQGSRAQPGLPVELRDETGKLIKATKADENGQFKFEEVPPGAYVVWSFKKIDDARGTDKVAVEAGKTSTASINVLRKP